MNDIPVHLYDSRSKVSEWLLFNANSAIYSYIMENNIFNEIMMRSTLYWTNTYLDFYIASSLKQQSTHRYRHVTSLRRIILISSQLVFALSPSCCMLSGEATYTNFIDFGLTWSEFQPTIYRICGKHANHYTTDAVIYNNKSTMTGPTGGAGITCSSGAPESTPCFLWCSLLLIL